NANWAYWLPRYWSDKSRYGTPPTSWVGSVWAEGVLFLPYGSTRHYPRVLVGMVDPATGWVTATGATRVHYGGEGEMNSWNNVYWMWNGENYSADRGAKGVDMNLVTYENESPAKLRDTYMADAFVGVFDEDAPRIGNNIAPPTGWVSGSSATIGYEFEDTGPGVRSAGVRPVGGSAWQTVTDFACSGTAPSPCPRKPISTEAGM